MTPKTQTGLGLMAGFLFFAITSVSAFAITAKEVTEKMSKEERKGYLTGLIDMRMFDAAQAGDAQLPKCIHDAYYRDIGDTGDAWSKLYSAFEQFPDKEATILVFLLVKKTCAG
jgi:hypothetical protein